MGGDEGSAVFCVSGGWVRNNLGLFVWERVGII